MSGDYSKETDGKYQSKLSIHLVIQDFTITGDCLKALLQQHKLDRVFDMSVYRKDQSKFRLAGFGKEGVKRRSRIVEGDLGDFVLMDIDGLPECPLAPASQAPPAPPPPALQPAPQIKTPGIKIPGIKTAANSEVAKLLNCIDPAVHDSYELWLHVGMILKNTDPNLKSLWIDWSRRCVDKFDLASCDSTWKAMNDNGALKLASLRYYAQKYGSDEYFKAFHFDLFHEHWNQGDHGLSEIFCGIYHHTFKCVDSVRGICYIFDETTALWQMRTIESLHNYLCRNMIPVFYQYIKYFKTTCQTEEDIKSIEAITKVAKSLTKSCNIKALYSFVKEHPLVFDESFRSKLNCKKDLLSVKNGVVDLRTGVLRPRRYDDYLTTFISVDYVPSAVNHDWERFIVDIFTNSQISDTPAVVEYLHHLLGYSITGYTKEQVMMIAYGSGSNGKGVLMDVLSAIFKEYYDMVDESIFDKKAMKVNANQASPELAKLFEKRLVYCNEIESGLEFGKVFKSLVDSGEITARNLHQNSFTFDLMCKFIINTNELPKFESQNSYIRRIIVLMFYNKYKDAKDPSFNKKTDKPIDLDLASRILANKEGVLTWLVQGSMKYFANGKLPPITPDFEKVKKQYVKDNDWSTLFHKTTNKSDFIDSKTIAENVMTTLGIHITSHQINKILKAQGYKEARNSARQRGFCYIGMNSAPEDIMDDLGSSSDDDDEL
jgi:P4 family phage/plasmid primase-like protien